MSDQSSGTPGSQEPQETDPAAAPPDEPGSSDGDRPAAHEDTRWVGVMRDITAGDAFAGFLAVVLAVLVGSLMIAFTDERTRDTFGYLFSRPGDFFGASWDAVLGAYTALFQGSVWNTRVDTFEGRIRPLTETLKFAAPLITAGLGVGFAFRAGLFNIGGRGQMLLAGGAAGWVGFAVDLPAVIHLPLAIAAGMLVGGLWGGLVGLLKARTGAHEVILTIMLNYVAFYLLFFALSEQSLLQAPNSGNPKSLPMAGSATMPKLLGDQFNLHLGFVLALVAVAITWWLLNRSALGFRIRAVGMNPHAARAGGIDVGRTYVVVFFIAGALVGLAGVNQVLGTVTSGVTVDVDAGIGFDAITVALLGRSRPLGILGAGLLFGAFKAGGFAMQASQNIPVDIVLVVQSLIVLFLAAPPLVRAIFRLPQKEAK